MFFIVVLLALGIFFVSSMFSKSPDVQPVKIESPQKPDKRSERRPHRNTSGQSTSSQQSPVKPNEVIAPNKPNSNSQGSTGSASSSVPNKPHNTSSSQINQSEGDGNEGTNGHVHSSGENSRLNNSTANKLNQIPHHGEEVVSSDQQTVMDAVNNGNKKQRN